MTVLVSHREKWLEELAFSKGDKVIKRGWWKYVEAELKKLEPEFPGATERVIARLKERNEQHNRG